MFEKFKVAMMGPSIFFGDDKTWGFKLREGSLGCHFLKG